MTITSRNTFAALALACTLGLGLSVSAQAMPAAPQTAPSNDNSSSQPISDTWITTKVKSELATTKGVDSMDVSVKTVNGVVTLIGVLPNDVAVDKAVAAAKSIKGVKQVDASGLKAKD